MGDAVVVMRVGFAGAVVEHRGRRICVDVVGAGAACDVSLFTHDHPRHYGGPAGGLVASPFAGVRLGEWARLDLGWASVTAVPAYNVDGGPHRRGCCLGYVIEVGGVTVYHAGDTDLVPEMVRLPRPTVALLPVGGGSVMEPEEAAEAVKTLRPSVAVPLHYDDRRSYWVFRDIAQPYTQVVDLKPLRWGRP